MEKLKETKQDFIESLLQVDRIRAAEIFKEFFSNAESFDILEKLVIESLEKLGEDWEEGIVSLSQIYMGGLICEELVDEYLPKSHEIRKFSPKMAIGVLCDHHALGKRIVYSVLRAGGYELLDFGYGLSADELVEKVIENQIDLLLISTLMLPSALKVKYVREKLNETGKDVKIIVGGAPFRLDKELWLQVGADGQADSAADVVKVIKRVVK